MLKTKEEIQAWLDKMKIENYIINDDLTVDVDGNVSIGERDLIRIPVQFGVIKGWFDCSSNKLKSLQGSPKDCNHVFDCSHNELTSLEFIPQNCKRVICYWNDELTSLEGAPKNAKIDSDFSKQEVEAYKNGNKIVESRLSKFRQWTEFPIRIRYSFHFKGNELRRCSAKYK
jgi:hypothetical protein